MKKVFLTLLIALMGCVSCVNEFSSEKPSGKDDGEEIVEISLNPSQTNATRAYIEEEDNIDELDLLIFSSKDEFLYSRQATKQNAKNEFKASLVVGSNLNAYFIANARTLIESRTLTKGVSWEGIRQLLIDKNSLKLSYDTSSDMKLPMFGLLAGIDVSADIKNSWGPVNLLRSVASVDVDIDGTVPEDKFKLKELYLYFAPDQGYLAPSAENFVDNSTPSDAAVSVIKPESPGEMKTTAIFDSQSSDNSTGKQSIANKLYLYENDATASSGDKRRTRVVIGGVYNNTMNYYPVDFFFKTKENPDGELKQVTRNNKYMFTVSDVIGEGYETPEEASEGASVNINYQVVEWNETAEGELLLDGKYYVGIKPEDKAVVLKASKDSQKEVIFTTNITDLDRINLKFGDTSLNGSTSELTGGDDGIRNERFKVIKTKGDKDGEIKLTIVALENFDETKGNEGKNEDVLIITSGRIEFEISIAQQNGDIDWNDGGGKEEEVS